MVVGRRRFTNGYRTIGEEEDSITMKEPRDELHEKQKHGKFMAEDRLLLRLGIGRWLRLGIGRWLRLEMGRWLLAV